MAREITIAKFKDVADGLQAGQFSIGERENVSGLDGLDPIYKDLLDRPITITLGLIGPDGRVGLTPMWFDYEDDHILVNTAAHRRKCGWIRNNPNSPSSSSTRTILITGCKSNARSNRRNWRTERMASGLPCSWIRFGRNIQATNRPTDYATRALMRRECSSSAGLTGLRLSANLEPPLLPAQ